MSVGSDGGCGVGGDGGSSIAKRCGVSQLSGVGDGGDGRAVGEGGGGEEVASGGDARGAQEDDDL